MVILPLYLIYIGKGKADNTKTYTHTYIGAKKMTILTKSYTNTTVSRAASYLKRCRLVQDLNIDAAELFKAADANENGQETTTVYRDNWQYTVTATFRNNGATLAIDKEERENADMAEMSDEAREIVAAHRDMVEFSELCWSNGNVASIGEKVVMHAQYAYSDTAIACAIAFEAVAARGDIFGGTDTSEWARKVRDAHKAVFNELTLQTMRGGIFYTEAVCEYAMENLDVFGADDDDESAPTVTSLVIDTVERKTVAVSIDVDIIANDDLVQSLRIGYPVEYETIWRLADRTAMRADIDARNVRVELTDVYVDGLSGDDAEFIEAALMCEDIEPGLNILQRNNFDILARTLKAGLGCIPAVPAKTQKQTMHDIGPRGMMLLRVVA